MATRNPDQGSQGSPRTSQPDLARAASGQAAGDVGSPISNEAYNVITALQSKLEGLEAYRKYSKDGEQQIWKELSDRDNEAVRLLVNELERIVRDGRLRPATPGKSASAH
jgi:hypothetical protein